MITTNLIELLTQIAQESPIFEVCGVIDNEGIIYSIENVSKTPEATFEFSKRQYLTVICKLNKEGKQVFCIYHTHPSNDPTPSEADIKLAHRIKFPSLIVTKQETRWVL